VSFLSSAARRLSALGGSGAPNPPISFRRRAGADLYNIICYSFFGAFVLFASGMAVGM